MYENLHQHRIQVNLDAQKQLVIIQNNTIEILSGDELLKKLKQSEQLLHSLGLCYIISGRKTVGVCANSTLTKNYV
jgi:hypothetical protein